jgi:beta-fructofuranosidase
LVPQWLRADERRTPILHWKLEETGNLAQESRSGTRDEIASRTGHAIWVGKGRNRSLRLDGYSVSLRHNASGLSFHGNSVTVMAWVALESYPVNEAAIVQLDGPGNSALRFSMDRLGFLQCGHHSGDQRNICRSSERVPKAKWVHLAASLGVSGITLYRDGAVCGQLSSSPVKFSLPQEGTFVLGGSPDCPVVADTFPTGMLNGLLRDVRVFASELTQDDIAAVAEESKPDGVPDLQINGPWCVADPHRPVSHAMPPRAWTNEPHGLIQWGGQYHLFYQKNPNGPYWGHIHWGHMTSPDLRRWTEMPVALSPEPGPDSEGCWSGSVINHDGQLAILYTAGDGNRSSICLATSSNGIHFTKHSGSPIISAPPEGRGFPEFRDPFVWREGDLYYLIIGSAVKDVGGTALLYRSKDLVTWEYRKQLLQGDKDSSGIFWEMPIFVKAGDHHALIVCEVPGRASYWVGEWKQETFTPFEKMPRRLELFNHLLSPTPMVAKNGQVTVMGIIPDERDPRNVWTAGWAHLYSFPRVLSADASGLLVQTPLEAIEHWTSPSVKVPGFELPQDAIHDFGGAEETSFRLRVKFLRGESRSVSVLVRRDPTGQEQTEIRYDWASARLILDRSKSSLDTKVRRDRQEAVYVPLIRDTLQLDVLVDRSVLEVFLDNRAAFAARIYPTLNQSNRISFAAVGPKARAEDLQLSRIQRPG